MIEEWKDIENFSNYQVSNLGNIKSKEHQYIRKDGVRGTRKEKILSSNRSDKSKYINVILKSDSGEPTNLNIHSVVAKAWIPNSDKNLIINHIDGNKHNNRVDNLEWVTYGENLRHAYRKSLRFASTKRCEIVDREGHRRTYASVKELCESENLNYGTVAASISNNAHLENGSKVYYV